MVANYKQQRGILLIDFFPGYGTLTGSHGCRIEWHNFRWPWVTPNPGFKVKQQKILQVEHLKNGEF